VLRVACVKKGEKYGAEYVRNLQAGVARHLSIEHEFLCLTDTPMVGVNCELLKHDLPGWWSKLELFRDGLFSRDDRVLYFDVDTLMVDNIDDIASYDGPFTILRDAYRPWGYQSGVMAFPGNSCVDIWDEWCRVGQPKLEGGDQAWIECMRHDIALLQDLFPDRLLSYKANCRNQIPPGASVVFFHGHPKPPECNGWVVDHWRNDHRIPMAKSA